MAVIVDCSAKRKNAAGQLVKTVCKNYHSKKHKKQRSKYNKATKKYQSHGNKKEYRQARAARKMQVAPPKKQGAKKRITPVLVNGPPPANNLVANARAPTKGQQRMLDTINRMERHYSNKANNDRSVVQF